METTTSSSIIPDDPSISCSSSSNTQWIATLSFIIGLIGLLIHYFVDIKITRRKPKKIALPPNAQPDRSMITCDASDCSETSPSKKCGQCRMVYYCSSTCQKKDWKYHKSNCQKAKTRRYAQLNLLPEEVQEPPKAPSEAECSICLAKGEDIQNPIVVKACQHAVCYKCMEDYQKYQSSLPRVEALDGTPCPYCQTQRDESERETILSKALLYTARASRSNSSEDKRQTACQLAIEQLQGLGKPQSDQDVLQANLICAHIAVVKGDYKDALKLYQQNERILTKLVQRKKQVDALLAKGQALGQSSSDNDDDDGMSDATYQQMQQIQNEIMALMAQGGLGKESDLIDCRLESIQIRLHLEEWETAQAMYQQVMTDYPEQSMMAPSQQAKVFSGFARCLYEQGNYQGAIAMGQAALQLDRHHANVHKYIALSHQAKGNLPQAQDVMAQAVWYETPWDDAHRSQVRDLWIELMTTTQQ